MGLVAFAILALLAAGSALGLILKKNPIHGALFLVVNLASVAALYLTLGAEFLAAAQVIVYAGAIMVLFVFAIMVLIPGKEETGPDARRPFRLAAIPLGGVLLVLLVIVVGRAVVTTGPGGAPGNVEAVGRLLFTDYLFPFELTSVLLLAAMVGVLLLARRRT
jgi:NADH-quinone oxidoreductase subunit J